MNDGADPALITTKVQLLAWIARHCRRHVQAGPHRCTCGWPSGSTLDRVAPSWQHHADTTLLADLRDALSRIGGPAQPPDPIAAGTLPRTEPSREAGEPA